MANLQKNKGKAFERDVAKFLTDTFNMTFTRVPNSGSFLGKSNKHRALSLDDNQAKLYRGDIVSPSDVSFVVECKSYRVLKGGFHSIMCGESNQINAWLSEVFSDALVVDNSKDIRPVDTLPHALVFKIANTGTRFWVLPFRHFNSLISVNTLTFVSYYANIAYKLNSVTCVAKETYLIVESQHFSNTIVKDLILKVIKK